MILWRRETSPRWLEAYEDELIERAGPALAIVSVPGRVRATAQVFCSRRHEAESLRRHFGGRIVALPRDWAKPPASHPPIRIGRRLQVLSAASFTRSETGLIIPAAGAFGTGEHATTAMSLRLLEEATRPLDPGWDLLDAGTGTGILALAGRRLGAGSALGLDNDPRAIAYARQNARLNQIARTKFLTADILQWKPPIRYAVVTANLFSELLIATLPIFHRALRRDGFLIVSGILREQAGPVVRALGRSGFRLQCQRRRGKWVALLATRKT